MTISNLLALLSGVFWTVVYIDSIRIGIKDESFAMPLWALGLNIAWELIYAILGYLHDGLSLQTVINGIWFLFDIGLIYTYFKYGQKYFPKRFKPGWFYGWGVFVIVVTFVVQLAFLVEFGYGPSAAYSAYLQNLLMSVLYIQMLLRRNSTEGQTLLIAVSKFFGSLAPTISFGVIGYQSGEPNEFILIIGILMAVFDVVYIGLLANMTMIFKKPAMGK